MKLKILSIFRFNEKWKNDEGQILVRRNTLILELYKWLFSEFNELCKLVDKFARGVTNQKIYLYNKLLLISDCIFKKSERTKSRRVVFAKN